MGRAILPELHLSLIAALQCALAAVPPRRRLVVGVSGGLDSMLLLETARQLGTDVPLLAVHVHHGLSPYADAWAQHVAGHCARVGVACEVLHVQVDRQRASLEAAAREARHAALFSRLRAGDALLLAHHADDQAETLLLRLFRGSGLTGLAAMRPARALGNDAWLLRPWLALSRQTLHDGATQAGLVWVDDESNSDTAFDRNFLRADVLPPLRTRWPALTRTLADTARRLAESDALLAEYLTVDLQPLLAPDPQTQVPTLRVAGLLAHPPAKQRALLRNWLALRGTPVFQARWLDEILQLAVARDDAEGEVRVAGWEIHRFRGCLYAFAEMPVAAADRVLVWNLRDDLDLGPGAGRLVVVPGDASGGLLIPAGRVVTVGFRRGGEKIRVRAGAGRRSLKNLFQEWQLPPWRRGRVPLIYVDGQLLAVADLLVDADIAAQRAVQPQVRVHWLGMH